MTKTTHVHRSEGHDVTVSCDRCSRPMLSRYAVATVIYGRRVFLHPYSWCVEVAR